MTWLERRWRRLMCWHRLQVAVATRVSDAGKWRFFECIDCGKGRWHLCQGDD